MMFGRSAAKAASAGPSKRTNRITSVRFMTRSFPETLIFHLIFHLIFPSGAGKIK